MATNKSTPAVNIGLTWNFKKYIICKIYRIMFDVYGETYFNKNKWVYFYESESVNKKFWAQWWVKKVMTTVIWDMKRAYFIDFPWEI